MMDEIVIDLYFDKNFVFVCRAVLEACGIRLKPTWLRVIWHGATAVEQRSCNVRWSFAATSCCTRCDALLLSFVGQEWFSCFAGVRWLGIDWTALLQHVALARRRWQTVRPRLPRDQRTAQHAFLASQRPYSVTM